MKQINEFLAEYPSTNGRLAEAVILNAIYVVTNLFFLGWGIRVDSGIDQGLGVFLLLLNGIDATQFVFKRKTERVTPPDTTVEATVEAAKNRQGADE